MPAQSVIELLYGASMRDSTTVLRLLAVLVVPFSMVPVLAYSLVSSFLQKFDRSVAGSDRNGFISRQRRNYFLAFRVAFCATKDFSDSITRLSVAVRSGVFIDGRCAVSA